MTILKKGSTIFSFLLVFAAGVAGQTVSKEFCKQIENSVVRKWEPVRFDRKTVFEHECWFEFTVSDHREASLSIKVEKTEEASRRSLNTYLFMVASHLGLANEKDLPLEKLNSDNHWDEAYFLKAGKINSGFILLRRGKTAITILSRSDDLLLEIEKTVRGQNLAVAKAR